MSSANHQPLVNETSHRVQNGDGSTPAGYIPIPDVDCNNTMHTYNNDTHGSLETTQNCDQANRTTIDQNKALMGGQISAKNSERSFTESTSKSRPEIKVGRQKDFDEENGDEKDEDVEPGGFDLDLDPDTRCGLGGLKMPLLQPCARIGCFTGYYSLAALITSTLNVYVNSQITTLERQFGFSSAQTGLIMAANDIGFLVCVLFLSYGAANFHIPRSLGVATGIFGLSGLACSLPFFLFRSSIKELVATVVSTADDNFTSASPAGPAKTSGLYGDLCLPNRTDGVSCERMEGTTETGTSSAALPGHVVTASLAIIFVGMMLQGFGKSPRYSFTVTYIDDNTGKVNTGFYMGIIITCGIFGPTLAFALGGIFSRIFVTLEETTLTPAHPRWIGAWWLGYIVCGVVALVVAVPLAFFPRRLPPRQRHNNRKEKESDGKSKQKETDKALLPLDNGRKEPTKERLTTANEDATGQGFLYFLHHFNSFVRAMSRLLTNPIYVAIVISTCFDIFSVSGSSAYLPKYIEQMFDMPAYMANYTMAGKTLCAACLGTFIGGYLSRRLKMTAKSALLFVFFVIVVGLAGTVMGFFFACEQPTVHNWPGSPDTSCSSACACEDNSYFAVCGSDGKTYYSPCAAGCLEVTDGVYHNCTCILGEGLAVNGMCPHGCAHIYSYVFSTAVRSLFGTLAIIPKLIVYIRSVEPRDKGLAVGFSAFMASLLGWLLGPIIFGHVIDGICTVWDISPCGVRGRCLLYNNDVFRFKLHMYCTGASLGSVSLLLFANIYAHCTGCLDEVQTVDPDKGQGDDHEFRKNEGLSEAEQSGNKRSLNNVEC